ncbi:MAG: GNAT family N-acetyltransferase [Deltaproteobacteria bacterium]|nr:GNAT family N-acetyltransferase [Deltaproteobacteria bacterium]
MVRQVRSQEEFHRALAIRLRVFVREQGVPRSIELDDDDQAAIHFLAKAGGRTVGTARLVMRNGQAKIGRMAVLKSYRGRGIGRELLKHAVRTARRRGAEKIFLHAQLPVVGFYAGMGFRQVGRVFCEAGIPHRKMILARYSEFRNSESPRMRST